MKLTILHIITYFCRKNPRVLPVLFVLSVLLLIPHSCIIPYVAEIDEEVEYLSIEGSLIKGEPVQHVVVSRTSPLIYPQFKPVRECQVVVVDNMNNKFTYGEEPDGTYSLNIQDEMLVFDREYKLQVTTPAGKEYESKYERMVSGAEVDTVYYQIEEKLDKQTALNMNGIQFYIDLKASDSTSRYYRWKLAESFEFTSIAPVTFYITLDSIVYPQNKTEVYRCWKTVDISRLFLSNTVNLEINEKKKIPLNYVSTQTDRLKIKYSLSVEQYTLNEGAYNYWEKNKIETQESGGLYTQQPGQPITNIYNVNDSSELVLGYFWISHKTEYRIFVPRIPSLPVSGDYCELAEFDPTIHKGPYPRYVWYDEFTGRQLTSTNFCFNCRLKGGKTIPPDFWE